MNWTAGRAFFRGSVSGSFAPQNVFTGQSAHRGLRGAHSVAPNSIRAAFAKRGLVPFAKRSANSQINLLPGGESIDSCVFASRLNTRAIFASTTAAGRSNAKLTMAPAVYLPTPGNFINSSTVEGNCSADRPTIIFAH